MTPFQPNPSQHHRGQAPGEAAEQSLAQVLSALRDATAPTGLEARILRNLQQAHASEPSPRPASLWSCLSPSLWPIQLRIPAATLAAAAVLTLLLAQKHTLLLKHPSSIATNTPTSITTPTTIAPQIQPHQVSILKPKLPQTSKPTPAASTPQSQPQLSPEDQLALEETNAPSLAAPPMPLTAQERLLLRVTRPGSAIEVAELEQIREPILRAAAADRDRANLQRYASGIIAPLLAFPNLDPTNPTPEDSPAPPR